jgi:amino acid transporter
MQENSKTEALRLGTFSGVFVPNILTILGVILFMRAGWVVGHAGLLQALLILLIANSITLMTAMSLSAVATNTKVEGGGAYHLISRSLGIEIGGGIGVPFFLAQAISVAFYVTGFVESLNLMTATALPPWTAHATLAGILFLAWCSSDLAIKAQNLILLILGAALLSFFLGWKPGVNHFGENLRPALSNPPAFWVLFALYFPAVTGIMSGASMSGDLKYPARSIPSGTLWAVGITFTIYAGQMLFFAFQATPEALRTHPTVMWECAIFPPVIYAGVWAATLSSAIASLLGAPRTLQALARDGIAPKKLAALSKGTGEPRLALLISAAVAALCLALGDLDTIAPVITMFFLATYGAINLAAGIECWSANPSYRPRFRVPWALSILGAISCFSVMLLLNAIATLVALSLMAVIFLTLASRRYESAWGDIWCGFWFRLTRTSLIKFARSRRHIRNWRPVILVLTGNPSTRANLVAFANFFESQRGFLFLARILTGPWQENLEKRGPTKETMDQFIRDEGLTGESRVIASNDFESGVCALIQSAGVGPLSPNTVMLGWSGDLLDYTVYLKTLRRILELNMNLILHREAKTDAHELEARIDLWWGAQINASLMLLLAHLLQSNREWQEHPIRLMRIARADQNPETLLTETRLMLTQARISATCEVMPAQGSPQDSIARHSESSSVTFLGFNLEKIVESPRAFDAQRSLLAKLRGHVFLCKNWEELQL